MKRLSLVAIAAIAILATTACERVRPSFSGVLVNNWASDDKGSITPLGRGLVWYNPISSDLYVFPLHVQRVEYAEEQAIEVRSKDRATLKLNVGHVYRFNEKQIPAIFTKYRTDPETLAAGVIRDAVRNSFVVAAGQYNAMDLLSSGLPEMQAKALESLKLSMVPEGIESEQLYVIGRPSVDKSIEDAISGTLSMIQEANREEEKVRQQTAIANQKIAAARGDAESTLLRAKAEAEAANLLAQQLNPLVIQNHAIAKWNGVLPTVSASGATPFINVPTK